MYYHYSGAIHIHTTDSDGTLPFDEVLKIGQECKLDFMMFSDHNTLKKLKEGKEGWYDKTLAIIGCEINDRDNKNHFLAFNLKETIPFGASAEEYVAEVARRGGVGIIAHPIETRSVLPQYSLYPWTAWKAEGYHGIELWNHMSEWMEHLTPANRPLMLFTPRRFLITPKKEVMETWDRLSQKQRVCGIMSADAHAFRHKILGPIHVRIFPYEVKFKALRTNLMLRKPLSQKFELAKDELLEALRNCSVYGSNFRWGDAKGFEFKAEQKGNEAIIGEEMEIEGLVNLSAKAPKPGRFRLICDGRLVKEADGNDFIYQTRQPGLYRIEVMKGNKGWIYSNHIRLTGKRQ